MSKNTLLKLTSLLFALIIFQNILLAGDKSNHMIVMTYNIRVAVDSGMNSWDIRKDKVAKMISFHHADIIGVQEALKRQLVDLANLLPGYKWFGVGRDDGKDQGEFSSIFYNEEKFELLNQSTFWLSDTPEKVSKGWDAALPRILTWGEFTDKSSGEKFFIFNTHFDHIGDTARQNSAKLILKKVKEIAGGAPSIIMGDFNVRPESKVYQILTDKQNPESLTDAMHVSVNGHYGSHISFNGFGNDIEAGNKIDYIFTKNPVKVYQHGIIGDTFDGYYPSDHMPVIAEISIGN